MKDTKFKPGSIEEFEDDDMRTQLSTKDIEAIVDAEKEGSYDEGAVSQAETLLEALDDSPEDLDFSVGKNRIKATLDMSSEGEDEDEFDVNKGDIPDKMWDKLHAAATKHSTKKDDKKDSKNNLKKALDVLGVSNEDDLQKSIDSINLEEANDILIKGKSLPVGTVKKRGPNNFIKTATGWKYHSRANSTKAEKPNRVGTEAKKESVGTMKKINGEMHQLVAPGKWKKQANKEKSGEQIQAELKAKKENTNVPKVGDTVSLKNDLPYMTSLASIKGDLKVTGYVKGTLSQPKFLAVIDSKGGKHELDPSFVNKKSTKKEDYSKVSDVKLKIMSESLSSINKPTDDQYKQLMGIADEMNKRKKSEKPNRAELEAKHKALDKEQGVKDEEYRTKSAELGKKQDSERNALSEKQIEASTNRDREAYDAVAKEMDVLGKKHAEERNVLHKERQAAHESFVAKKEAVINEAFGIKSEKKEVVERKTTDKEVSALADAGEITPKLASGLLHSLASGDPGKIKTAESLIASHKKNLEAKKSTEKKVAELEAALEKEVKYYEGTQAHASKFGGGQRTQYALSESRKKISSMKKEIESIKNPYKALSVVDVKLNDITSTNGQYLRREDLALTTVVDLKKMRSKVVKLEQKMEEKHPDMYSDANGGGPAHFYHMMNAIDRAIKEKSDLKKSIDSINLEEAGDILTKGQALPVGTVKKRGPNNFIKTATGWKYHSRANKATGKKVGEEKSKGSGSVPPTGKSGIDYNPAKILDAKKKVGERGSSESSGAKQQLISMIKDGSVSQQFAGAMRRKLDAGEHEDVKDRLDYVKAKSEWIAAEGDAKDGAKKKMDAIKDRLNQRDSVKKKEKRDKVAAAKKELEKTPIGKLDSLVGQLDKVVERQQSIGHPGSKEDKLVGQISDLVNKEDITKEQFEKVAKQYGGLSLAFHDYSQKEADKRMMEREEKMRKREEADKKIAADKKKAEEKKKKDEIAAKKKAEERKKNVPKEKVTLSSSEKRELRDHFDKKGFQRSGSFDIGYGLESYDNKPMVVVSANGKRGVPADADRKAMRSSRPDLPKGYEYIDDSPVNSDGSPMNEASIKKDDEYYDDRGYQDSEFYGAAYYRIRKT